MIKTTKKMTLDTATATVVKKVTCGVYGDPAGYETTLFLSPEGNYFLYTNGGEASPYTKESITYFTKAKALEWMDKN